MQFLGYGFDLGLEKERLRCGGLDLGRERRAEIGNGLDLGLDKGAKIGDNLEQIKGKEPLNWPFRFSSFSSTNAEQSKGRFRWVSDPIFVNNEQRKD